MKPIIEVKNLYISFKERKVLKGVTFSLSEGECLALIGGSGEGKSTLLRSIIGLEYPTSGQIFFSGENILRFGVEQYISIRKQISYVFQGGALFDSMTVYDNLAFPLREHTDWSEEKIRKAVLHELKEFELEGSENIYPMELSGGMQKRVGVARATIIKPKVILYDEPTSGLDPYTKRNMQKAIMKMQKRGATSMIVTHDMQTALKICDRVALLKGGKIQAVDTPKNFRENPNILLNNFIKGIKQGENYESA
ncbi:MAG: ATP-binding cassette domain-containing protein [Bdellovibrionales bacterium]|nr:ATP-binding cassette domain-containing protein [Bdellovibrionales bacterium]